MRKTRTGKIDVSAKKKFNVVQHGSPNHINLDKETFESHMSLAEKVYPDLSQLRATLKLFPADVVRQYETALVANRVFIQRHDLVNKVVGNYLCELCASNNELVSYGLTLFKEGDRSRLSAYLQACKVLGGGVEKEVLSEYIDTYSIKELVADDLKQIQTSAPPRPRLRKISSSNKNENIDIDALYKKIKHKLLQYALLRAVIMRPYIKRMLKWMWRSLYFQYSRRINPEGEAVSKWLPITTYSQHAKRTGRKINMLYPSESFELSSPDVTPFDKIPLLGMSELDYVFPEIFVSTISKTRICGESNIIITEKAAVCHDLYFFERDYTSEELHGRAEIKSRSNMYRNLRQDAYPETIPAAATFVDSIAQNYAHWITEVLPRVLLFCIQEEYKHIPIVVNDGLHPNIMESLLRVAGEEREIITLPVGRDLKVDKLYLTSTVGYVPFEPRGKKHENHSHGVFSPYALNRLREYLHNQLPDCTDASLPKRIFLRRKSGFRKLLNIDEVESVLASKGFYSVEAGSLTFMQQVLLFSNAEVVIGATGAACANAVFCRKGAKVGVLISEHEDMIYGYWRNMLEPIGIKVYYLLGNIFNDDSLGVHSDFVVDLPLFQKFLKKMSIEDDGDIKPRVAIGDLK